MLFIANNHGFAIISQNDKVGLSKKEIVNSISNLVSKFF